MGQVLSIVYRAIATHLTRKAGYTKATAQTGAVTLIQRFGGSVNLNIHFHMLFLDGVYIDSADRSRVRFRWVKAPNGDEMPIPNHRSINCSAVPLRATASPSYSDPAGLACGGSGLRYRVAIGSQKGCKVFTLHTLPDCGDDPCAATVGTVAGFSLHAGVAARANEREKLERLCRYIARPAVSTKRLSLTRNGQVDTGQARQG
jgi:hypothetical protein